MHEYGVFTAANGRVYGRDWENGIKHGCGVLIYANGTVEYRGEMQNNGYGINNWADRRVFSGDFKNHQANGSGALIGLQGDRCEGGFDCGYVVSTYLTGASYCGQLNRGQKNGFGVCISANGEKYDGHWKNDLRDGAGILTLPTGEKYEGTSENGERVITA